MAHTSLAVRPLSRNDVSILAQLFEVSFDYYIDNRSSSFTDYLRSLRTLAGLGFTATLVDRSLLCVYQQYLGQFMAQKEGNFKETSGAKTHIAQSLAEMVCNAAISFSALKCPRYYEDFYSALHFTIAKTVKNTKHEKEAQQILSQLTPK